MQISLKSDIVDVMKDFQDVYAKSIPFAIAGAINDTLFEGRQALSDEEKEVFDKPTYFTTRLDSWQIDKANVGYGVGTIKLKAAQADYLQWEVFGGRRTPKKRSIGMPQDDGELMAEHGGLVKNWKRVFKNDTRYFSGTPRNHPNARPGVYQRLGAKAKKGQRSGHKLRLELAWEASANYPNKIFNFDQTIYDYVHRNFRAKFRQRLEASRLYQQTH